MAEKIWKDTNDEKSVAGALDLSTVKAIYRLSDKGAIDSVEGIINEGKESVILLARLGEDKRIIKAYKVNATNFHNMQKYILGDSRFHGIKRDKRSVVYAWCKKEFSNLSRAKKAGVSVPKPYAFTSNALILELIGKDAPAPALNKASIDDPKKVLDEIVREIRKLYHGAGLVHADLSQFNILMDNEKVVLIDFGQAVLLDHPLAEEFLQRDIKNICRYFSKLGVKCDNDEVLKEVIKGSSV